MHTLLEKQLYYILRHDLVFIIYFNKDRLDFFLFHLNPKMPLFMCDMIMKPNWLQIGPYSFYFEMNLNINCYCPVLSQNHTEPVNLQWAND